MNDFDKERLFWILQAVKDDEMSIEGARTEVIMMAGEIEYDAYQRGRDYSIDFNSL